MNMTIADQKTKRNAMGERLRTLRNQFDPRTYDDTLGI